MPKNVSRLSHYLEHSLRTFILVQHLLSPVRKPNAPISNRAQYSCLRRYGLSDTSPSLSDASLPGSPISRADGDYSHKSLRPYIYTIDIVPEDYSTGSYGSSDYYNQSSTESSGGLGGSSQPRPIRTIDPTLVFTSGSELPTTEVRSVFRVYQNEQQWKDEHSSLQLLDSTPYSVPNTTHMYTISFSKSLWEAICSSEGEYSLSVWKATSKLTAIIQTLLSSQSTTTFSAITQILRLHL